MIKFDHNDGELKAAVFGGNVETLCADLSLEISLIYGAMKRRDEKLADLFKRSLFELLTNRDFQDVIFSTEFFDAIASSGAYESGSITIADKEEFAKQLKELLEDESE